MQYIQDSPFFAPCTITYASNNTVDATKTLTISNGIQRQTVTFNSDGKVLTASNLEKV